MEKRFVYADNAATTRVSKTALDAALPYFTEHYGNASSIYMMGREEYKEIFDILFVLGGFAPNFFCFFGEADAL